MDQLLNDVRFAWRALARRPGFALVAVLTLAVGIGANTAVYSIAEAVLLRPLPFREPEPSPKPMSESPKRLAPAPQTLRELFLKSGNLCAFSSCAAILMNSEGTFIGQLCHIEAAERGGERFNAAMTNEGRRAASNLMLMCYEHHQITNDVQRYTTDVLRQMKATHELRFTSPDRATYELLAKAKWSTLLGAGVDRKSVV